MEMYGQTADLQDGRPLGALSIWRTPPLLASSIFQLGLGGTQYVYVERSTRQAHIEPAVVRSSILGYEAIAD